MRCGFLELGDGHRQPMSRPFKRIGNAHAERQMRPPLRRTFRAARAHHNSRNGRCDPSQTTIGRHAGFRRETVNRHCRELRAEGWLDWTQRGEWVEEETGMFDLFGEPIMRRVVRQRSNQYFFGWRVIKFLQGITLTRQNLYHTSVVEPDKSVDNSEIDPSSPLGKALARLADTIRAAERDGKPPD